MRVFCRNRTNARDKRKGPQEVTKVSEMAESGPMSLPLRLAFTISAYRTLQRMIHFSNQEAGSVSLLPWIFLPTFGSPMTMDV